MKINLNTHLSPSSTKGFTLLEALIALFIFTILSLILVGALRSVMDAHAGTEKAERLRKLQFALLLLSRDIEQMVNRPIFNATGEEEPGFTGTSNRFSLTHAGFANLTGSSVRPTLERTGYAWNDGSLWRLSWDVLDQAPQSQPHFRKILSEISSLRFQYLNQEGQFVDNWPTDREPNQSLPRAVRVQFTISQWGKITQLYVIPIQNKHTQLLPSSEDKP